MNVMTGADIAHELARRLKVWSTFIPNPAINTVRTEQSVIHRKGLSLIKGLPKDFPATAIVIRVNSLAPAETGFIIQTLARECQPRLVEINALFVGIRNPDHDGS
nr:hypothetical protein [Marinobacter sp.]